MELMKKRDHIIYSVTGNVGTAEVNGIIGIKFITVRDRKYVIEALPKKVPFLKRARVTFPFDGTNLADLGGVLVGWSVLTDGTAVGEEKIPTLFGERALIRYQRSEVRDNGTLHSEQFVEPVHNFPYAARMSGHGGEVLFSIIDTSLKWIKEE